ncbi:superinfection immunity protein [Streptococcus salivarius]|uniref:superinfection immunity protein n=1 Tax=Streptococcus salivarius TaxID=1304 RepID=UPI0012BBF269|nr:superinfection immunity protein [Streptococcus salivarius]MTQ29255.1 superinfection immunity protein [Streptococcus salivarius]MTQ37113.1 superinfection immunity protein [Streptococcus salivarius]MTQ42981.1 superinfection immunity protein [Streptococcus salivarius]MTQ45301.1 superinfection immunity protein [Streptococcus salivarius]MTQ54654.1 superinfection immunity protein [Streptococcus salivarius]
MKQQDWIDFFQAVNGRNPSIQEMAEAAQKGEFVRETPKQTVEITKPVPQKDTVETKQDSEGVEPTEPAPSTEVVETAEKDVDSYDVAEEPLTNSTADEEETFQATNLSQEKQSKTFQEQVKPVVETASQTVNQFANQTGETFQQASKNLNETWKKQDKKTQTNFIMLAIADIPFIIWALGIYLIGVASDEVGATLPSALFLLIFSLPFVALIILPALLNKTDNKWLIFVLSILLNWTFIGWVILLVVSINMNKEAERIKQQQMMMQMAGQQGSSGTFNPFQ